MRLAFSSIPIVCYSFGEFSFDGKAHCSYSAGDQRNEKGPYGLKPHFRSSSRRKPRIANGRKDPQSALKRCFWQAGELKWNEKAPFRMPLLSALMVLQLCRAVFAAAPFNPIKSYRAVFSQTSF